ncbi:MAG: hypothetical protein ACQKHC_03315 [Candidatus Phytoplasma pruni]
MKTLEAKLNQKEEDLKKLQQDIRDKENALREKENALNSEKQLSTREKELLNKETEQLKTQIATDKINFEVQMQLKDQHIQALKANETFLKEKLQNKKEETRNLRDQHEKTLTEIKNQIEKYQQQIKELEAESNNLKLQLEQNQNQSEVLKNTLLSKQKTLNEISAKINELQLTYYDLSKNEKAYHEWLDNCDIKDEYKTEVVNGITYRTQINSKTISTDESYKKLKDQTFYYSPTPFKITITDSNGPVYTYDSPKLKNKDIYYVRFDKYGDYFYLIDEDRNKITNKIYYKWRPEWDDNIKSKYSSITLTENVSTTIPPITQFQIEQIKKTKEGIQTLINEQQQLQEEINNLIQQTTTNNPGLQEAIRQKEAHIQKLKDEQQALELKEKGYQTNIQQLEQENTNLKEKYHHDLNQVKTEWLIKIKKMMS